MKGTIVSLVVVVSTLFLGAATDAQGRQNPDCSNATVQGSYGFTLNGTVPGAR